MSNISQDEKSALMDDEKQQQKVEISTRDAYFASLNEWVQHANMSQNAQSLFPWYLLSNFQNPIGPIAATSMPNFSANNLNFQEAPMAAGAAAAPANFSLFRVLDENAQNELINRAGGFEYVIAPFWKRAVAETIDVILLLILKILILFAITNIFDLDLGIDLDKETLRKAVDEDDYASFVAVSMDFLALSSDLLMLEILTKIIVCFNEAIWTTMYNGATPGKAIMNLRIVYVEAILPLQQQPPQLLVAPLQNREPMRALLYPAATPNFMRAFFRAIGKNLIMTLLFPMCFVMIFFKNNRTAYDIMTKTVVIENNPNVVLRRQQR